jgi:HD-like signal output (HDOD) protein
MSADPGLTGAILRLANSAYFGFPRKVATVTQAIVVLGFETVKSLATGASVFRAIRPGPGSGLDPDAFFRHGIAAATGARLAMERTAPRLAGSAFSAGILHDLGRLVIAEFLDGAREEVAKRIADGEAPEAAETAVLGLDHAAVGGWFAGRWAFPDDLTAAIRWHHDPTRAGEHAALACAVHVGDLVAHMSGSGGSGRPVPPTPDEAALARFHLDEAALAALADRTRELDADPRVLESTLG